MKPTIQRRYKLYRQTLLGKVTSDQFLEVFDKAKTNEENKNTYSGSFVENETYWIGCISKIESSRNHYYSTPDKEVFYNDVAFATTLYMHKFKDIVVAKVSLVTYGQWDNRSNVVNNVFMRMLKTLGYDKTDFNRETKDYCKWRTRTVKILIPPDKTEDDLVELIQAVEKYNNFVRDNESSMSTWDNLQMLCQTVKNLIKPENDRKEDDE